VRERHERAAVARRRLATSDEGGLERRRRRRRQRRRRPQAEAADAQNFGRVEAELMAVLIASVVPQAENSSACAIAEFFFCLRDGLDV
jgi:hypothetical protein